MRSIPKTNPAVSRRYYRWVLQAHPILFARFENALSESEEAVESRVEMMPAERSTGHQASAAFDNPMYGKTKVRTPLGLSARGQPLEQSPGFSSTSHYIKVEIETKYKPHSALPKAKPVM